MSHPWFVERGYEFGFPRVSGDEPSDVNAYTPGAWFSPRERG